MKADKIQKTHKNPAAPAAPRPRPEPVVAWTREPVVSDALGPIPYTHPQPTGLLSLREYLFVTVGDTRCVLLRWVREADFPVNSVTVEITQTDGLGTRLGSTRVTYGENDLPPHRVGELFTPSGAIPVDPACTEVRVRLCRVESGDYLYRVRRDLSVTVDYGAEEPWAYDDRAGESEGLSDTTPLRVISKAQRRVPLRALVTLGGLVALLVALFWPYL